MHRFHLDTNIQPLEPTCLKVSLERSKAWVQQILECHYYRPAAIAYSAFDLKATAAEPITESDSVESRQSPGS
jgi:hypothetical protein